MMWVLREREEEERVWEVRGGLVIVFGVLNPALDTLISLVITFCIIALRGWTWSSDVTKSLLTIAIGQSRHQPRVALSISNSSSIHIWLVDWYIATASLNSTSLLWSNAAVKFASIHTSSGCFEEGAIKP
jgi:hypothetical protein